MGIKIVVFIAGVRSRRSATLIYSQGLTGPASLDRMVPWGWPAKASELAKGGCVKSPTRLGESRQAARSHSIRSSCHPKQARPAYSVNGGSRSRMPGSPVTQAALTGSSSRRTATPVGASTSRLGLNRAR